MNTPRLGRNTPQPAVQNTIGPHINPYIQASQGYQQHWDDISMAQHPTSHHSSMMPPDSSSRLTRSPANNFSEVMPSSFDNHRDPTVRFDLGVTSAQSISGNFSEVMTSAYPHHNLDPRNCGLENPYRMTTSFEHRDSNPVSLPPSTGNLTPVDRAGWLWSTEELVSMVETMQREKNNQISVPHTINDSGHGSQVQLNEDRASAENNEENPSTTATSLSKFDNISGEETYAYGYDHFAEFDPATPQDTQVTASTPGQAMWDIPLNNMVDNAIPNIASGNGHSAPSYKAMAALKWRVRRSQRSHAKSHLERNGGKDNGMIVDHGSNLSDHVYPDENTDEGYRSQSSRQQSEPATTAGAADGLKRRATNENSDDAPPAKKVRKSNPLRAIDNKLEGNKPDPNHFPPPRVPGEHLKMDFTPRARIPKDNSPTDDEAFTHRNGQPTERYKAEQKSKRLRWVLGAFEAADGNDSSVHAAPPGGLRQDLPPLIHHRFGLRQWLIDRRSPLVPATTPHVDCVQFIKDAGNELQWNFKNWAEGQAWMKYQEDSRAWQNAHRREKARKKAKKYCRRKIRNEVWAA